MSEEYFLHKVSAPGWTKSFTDKAKLAEELSEQICANCMCEVYGSISESVIQTDQFIEDMLSTCCGTEFDMESSTQG